MTDSLIANASPQIQQAAELFKQWTIFSPDGATIGIQRGRRYLLKNRINRHFLQYKKQGTFGGINLGFSDDAEPSTAEKVLHWEFVNSSRTPVRYDEPVAIRCKDGYLRYGHRNVGINLLWSDNPVFEWRLLGGPVGAWVSTRDWLCIWNAHSTYGEPLIYSKREIGGNVGWPSSKTLLEQGLDWAKETVQKAVVEYFESQAGDQGLLAGGTPPGHPAMSTAQSGRVARPHQEFRCNQGNAGLHQICEVNNRKRYLLVLPVEVVT